MNGEGSNEKSDEKLKTREGIQRQEIRNDFFCLNGQREPEPSGKYSLILRSISVH